MTKIFRIFFSMNLTLKIVQNVLGKVHKTLMFLYYFFQGFTVRLYNEISDSIADSTNFLSLNFSWDIDYNFYILKFLYKLNLASSNSEVIFGKSENLLTFCEKISV